MSFPVSEHQKWEIFCHFEVGIRSRTKEILKIFGGFFVATFRNILFPPPLLFSQRPLLNRNVYKFSYLVILVSSLLTLKVLKTTFSALS